jgi:hypothetical protein
LYWLRSDGLNRGDEYHRQFISVLWVRPWFGTTVQKGRVAFADIHSGAHGGRKQRASRSTLSLIMGFRHAQLPNLVEQFQYFPVA